MSINPLKEFFKRRKAEVKFARAGPGQKLSSDSQTAPSSSSAASSSEQSSARQAAAEAALKRFSKDSSKPSQRPRITTKTQSTTSKTSDTKVTGSGGSSEVDKVVQKELPVVDGIAQRDVQSYSTDELAQRMKQPDIDDDFFRLTVEDAKLFKQRYDEERARNEILKTSEMRRRDAEAKKPTTNVARLRFKLPNNMVLEASFSGSETLNLVRNWLVASCSEKFNYDLTDFDILFVLKPFKETDYQKSIKSLGLLPATTLTIVQKNN